MAINLVERLKDTMFKTAVIGGALYTISAFDLGRGAVMEASYRAPPVLSRAVRDASHYFYDNTGIVTSGLIVGAAANMLRKRKDEK